MTDSICDASVAVTFTVESLGAATVGAQECRGNFNADGRVSIDELVTAVLGLGAFYAALMSIRSRG